MIAPWHAGEVPHEDAEGVLHFFMSKLSQICPHVGLRAVEENADRLSWRRGDLYHRFYVRCTPVGRVFDALTYYLNDAREMVWAPHADDYTPWPDEFLDADTPHNRESLLKTIQFRHRMGGVVIRYPLSVRYRDNI